MRMYATLLWALLLLPVLQSFAQGNSGLVIRHIIVEGNTRTRSSIIVREMSIAPGDRVVADSIPSLKVRNRQRIYNLQLFNEVEQEPQLVGADSIDWHVRVRERWAIIPTGTLQFADRNLNTWWVEQNHDVRRAIAGLTITDKNFRGNLEMLAATVQVGYVQKLGINYTRPYINKKQTSGLGFTASIAQSRQTYYATDSDKLVYTGVYDGPVIMRQADVCVSYIYRPAYKWRHIVQLSYKDYRVSDSVLLLNPLYFSDHSKTARLAELQYRFEYNGVDNWNYSLRGFKLVGYALARKGLEGMNYQLSSTMEAGVYRPLGGKWYSAATFRGRALAQADNAYYFRGGLGSTTDYVRGYEYYVIDGYNYGMLRVDLKRELFNNTYSLPIRYFTAFPIRIYPKLFADAGYINHPHPGNNFLANTMLYSIGAGVDIVTLYDIKIRVEFARNHLGQNGLYLHFNSE